MNTKQLDDEQRAAYLADHNVVIAAGAGSGKTTVLSQRYVRLVTEKQYPVDSILTLTFTRKAAAEMFSRIYQELSRSDSPFARQQLERFDTARISTLDSFCSAIVRSSCSVYGIPPTFSIDENRLEALALQTSLELLMEYRQRAALGILVSHYNFDTIARDLLAAICINHIPLINTPNYTELAQTQVDQSVVEIKNLANEVLSILEDIVSLETNVEANQKQRIDTVKNFLRDYRTTLEHFEASDNSVNALCQFCSDATNTEILDKPKRNIHEGPGLTKLSNSIQLLRDTCTSLMRYLHYYRYRDHLVEFGSILNELAQRFIKRKKTQGLLSFSDLLDLAVDILTRSLPLRNYYKKTIQAIMIDEFQDNNEKQKQLLFLLAEREDLESPGIPGPEQLADNKLFFVGDEKQSIYRFRGADVSVFKGLAQDLERTPKRIQAPSILPISTNYRSTAELVEFFNCFFPRVFGSAQERFEAAYTPARPSPTTLRDTKVVLSGESSGGAVRSTIPNAIVHSSQGSGSVIPRPAVEFYVGIETTSSEAENGSDTNQKEKKLCKTDEREALVLAQRLLQGFKDKEFAPKDVAVLFRSTTHQSVFERVFRTIGLPVSSADPRGLFMEAPANDFYALLRLALFPRDKNAYATVLRSPFVQLNDTTFLSIMLDCRTNRDWEPFPENPPERWFNQATEDRTRFVIGRSIYQQVLGMIDRCSLAHLLSWLWYYSGYRTSLLMRPDMESLVSHYELLYRLAVEADERHITAAAFIDELAPLMGTAEKIEGDDTDLRSSAITFMTIHKSKGLQFPVVVIPQAGAYGKGLRNDAPFYFDKNLGPIINWKSDSKAKDNSIKNPFFEAAKEQALQEETAELKRLLYVALTRAEKKCLIVGHRHIPKKELEQIVDSSGNPQEQLIKILSYQPDSAKSKVSFLDLAAPGFSDLVAKSTSTSERSQSPSTLSKSFVSKPLFGLYQIPSIAIAERTQKLREYQREFKEYQQQTKCDTLSESELEAFYKREPRPILKVRRSITSPTSMEQFRPTIQAQSSGSQPSGILPRMLPELSIDKLLTRPLNSRQNSESQTMETAFGTLCHSYLSALLERRPLETPPSVQSAFKQASLSIQERQQLMDEALKLGAAFLESTLGHIAIDVGKNSPCKLKTEYTFLLPLLPSRQTAALSAPTIVGTAAISYPAAAGTSVTAPAPMEVDTPIAADTPAITLAPAWEPVLIKGSIDCIFEYNNLCYIIDFKTDRNRNPESHRIQMECYYRAAKAFSDLPVKMYLVYLRSMEAVEIAAQLDNQTLYQIAQQSLAAPELTETPTGFLEDTILTGEY
ncbi:MAG: UvrD-helicase domain-containing protein [Termitinemataceae bacterium]